MRHLQLLFAVAILTGFGCEQRIENGANNGGVNEKEFSADPLPADFQITESQLPSVKGGPTVYTVWKQGSQARAVVMNAKSTFKNDAEKRDFIAGMMSAAGKSGGKMESGVPFRSVSDLGDIDFSHPYVSKVTFDGPNGKKVYLHYRVVFDPVPGAITASGPDNLELKPLIDWGQSVRFVNLLK